MQGRKWSQVSQIWFPWPYFSIEWIFWFSSCMSSFKLIFKWICLKKVASNSKNWNPLGLCRGDSCQVCNPAQLLFCKQKSRMIGFQASRNTRLKVILQTLREEVCEWTLKRGSSWCLCQFGMPSSGSSIFLSTQRICIILLWSSLTQLLISSALLSHAREDFMAQYAKRTTRSWSLSNKRRIERSAENCHQEAFVHF